MEIKRKKNLLIVTVEGDFDLSQCSYLRQVIFEAIEEKGVNRVIFDMGNVPFLDSSALGLLLTVYKKTAPLGGGVGVKNLSENLLQYFEMAGLTKILSISLKKEGSHDELQ